jgi:hypothetical protein
MNKYWKMKDGRMVRRQPIVEHDSSIDYNDGLTVTYTTIKTVTLNIEQLKRACTADKHMLSHIDRNGALKILSGLIRKHRYDLFGTCEGYRIITNGYGQFKEVDFSHGNPVKAETIFNKLEQFYPLDLTD